MIRSHLRHLRSACLVLSALVIGCSGDGPSAPPPSPSITISTPASTLAAVGATLQLNATALNTTSLPTWSSANPAVATVTPAGLVTAVGNGTTVMTASVPDASATVSITVAQTVSTVVMTPSTLTIEGGLGDTGQLTAAASDVNGNPVAGVDLTWSTEDAALATVSSTGLVTAAVREGFTIVRAAVGTFSASASITITDPPGPFVIEAEYDSMRVAPSASSRLRVNAFDQETGEAVAFTASGGSCATGFNQVDGELLFNFNGGANTTCPVLLAAPGVTKTVTVRGYDPQVLSFDGLSMRYTNDFSFILNNDPAASNDWHGNGQRVTAWRPIAPPDWYPVGHHFETRGGGGSYSLNISAAGTGDVPMVLLRDDSGTNLRAPSGYTLIWSSFEDCGTLCFDRPAIAWVWRPNCPTGFFALGSVATSSAAQPSTEAIRCVADARTAVATQGGFVFSDAGSGADNDLAIFAVGAVAAGAARTDGRVPMSARATVACGTGSPCAGATYRQLAIRPQVMESGGTERAAALTDWAPMPNIRNSSRRVRIPFTLVRSMDPEQNGGNRSMTRENAESSPFFFVETVRTTSEVVGFNNRCLSSPTTLTYTTTESRFTEQSNSFSEEYGVRFSIEGEVGFLGTGTTVTAEVSATFNWTSTTSSGFASETSISLSPVALPRHYVAIVGKKTEIYLRDAFNNQVGPGIRSEGSQLAGLEYTGPNWKNSPTCGGS